MTGEELKSLRMQHGYSLKGLAQRLGLRSERSLRRWEKGEYAIPGPIRELLKIIFSEKVIK